MKITGKTWFKLAAATLAVLMSVQMPAAGAGRRVEPVLKEPAACAAEAGSKPEALAVIVQEPVDPVKTAAVEPAVAAIAPAVENSKPETQDKENNIIAAEPLPQLTAAVSLSDAQQILPGVLYDEEENLLYGPGGRGLVYIGFDYDIDQNLFYSSINCWQKAFGYNNLYDALAPLGAMFFDARSIYFNYDGLEWMLKLWKGQYGITSGAEVGIYTKSSLADTHYVGVDEENFILMDMKLLRNGEPYFTREAQMHWWLSGFIVGDITAPEDLYLESTITFKDRAMTDAFIAALGTPEQTDAQDVVCVDNGTSVTLAW